MTTENIRITGYLVPEISDRFEEFCQENQLNCSKALNVILAEYLGVETKLVEQTWIGGVTLVEFEKLKKEVNELRKLVNIFSTTKSITAKTEEIKEEKIEKIEDEEEIEKQINEEIKEKINKKIQEKINEGLSEAINKKIEEEINKSNDEEITLKLNTTELAKRFNISRASINSYKRKFKQHQITKEDYIQWTRKKDPDNKGWFFDENTNYSV